MRFKLFAVILLLAASSAFAQYPQPVITSISPAEGTARGGTLVTLTGSGFESCPPYLIGCTTATVFIGGKAAEIVELSASRVVVRTPANTSGTYDIEVVTRGGRAQRENAFTYGSRAFVRVLLPTYIEGEVNGTFGSKWVTELTGFLRGNGSARIGEDPASSDVSVSAGTPFKPFIATQRQGLGRFIYVSTEAADRITFNLRVRDVSRSADNLGVEVPVIQAGDTFGPDSVIALVNVPNAPNYRQKLRIYDFDGEYGRTVRVTADGVTREVTLSSGDLSGDFLAYPGYAEVDFDGVSDVTIETPDEGRFWAYVSVTNNNTQQVTTVTP